MRYIDNFRDAHTVDLLLDNIKLILTQKWVVMEVCGGQTHSFFKSGLDKLLPNEIELIHGPGCPVCVTPLELIDKAIYLSEQSNVVFTSFGDMLRVPGSNKDLFSVRAQGGNIKVVYSPLDAVNIARSNPEKEVVFFAIGFETTAPANIMSVLQAKKQGIKNFSLLVSQVRVPPAINMILDSPHNRVHGILGAGHVCAVMGYWEYIPISIKYRVPIVITGFEPTDLLKGIFMTINQLENKRCSVENGYSRIVTEAGNIKAQDLIKKVFEPYDQEWRGIGTIPSSGWKLRKEYADYDAEKKFKLATIKTQESTICISGQILQGIKTPPDCPAFARECTPTTPLGATMVSSEGTCAAYYRYQRSSLLNLETNNEQH